MRAKKLIAGLTVFAVVLGIFGVAVPKSSAAIGNWQKGASIFSEYNTDFAGDHMKQSLRDLKAANANYVSFIIPYRQSDRNSANLYPAWNTPTDASLIAAIDYAHSIGLKVALKPHLETEDGQWRAYINAGDREAWFAAYGGVIKHYATIAEAHNVEDIVIGTELIGMAAPSSHPTNTQNWNELIAELRAIYSGKLTYSANWSGELDQIAFWPALDYIGISAYFDNQGDNSVASQVGAWTWWDNNVIKPLSQRWGKQIVFTEVGYRNIPDAQRRPWDYGGPGGDDDQTQANLYEALFSYWDAQPHFSGVQLWRWNSNPASVSAGNTDYTPQGKMAEGVMREWFGTGGNNGTTTPPVTASTTFSVTATTNPTELDPGTATDIDVSVAHGGLAVADTTVNLTIWDSAGNKDAERTFTGQDFASTSSTYAISWTPATEGNYLLKAAILSGNGATTYYNDTVMTLDVDEDTNNGTTTPPVATTTPPVATSTPPITDNEVENNSIDTTAASYPGSPQIGSTADIDVEVRNTGTTTLSNALVWMTIADSSGGLVAERTFNGITLETGQAPIFTMQWSPTTAGSYSVGVGIYADANKSVTILRDKNLRTLTVTGQ
jgi:hypothetical protein